MGDVDVAHTRYRRYVADGLPRFRAAAPRAAAYLRTKRAELGVDGLKATPIGSFVRNALIDEVYLPLIGDNLAKQLGPRDEAHRPMGLLLLISPARLRQDDAHGVRRRTGSGFAFVKVNGPALGHDGDVARPGGGAERDRAARRSRRSTSRFAMGNNVMLLPRRHPAHVSRSCCRSSSRCATRSRRIEGVWDGGPRTYDLRGQAVRGVHGRQPVHRSRASGSGSRTCSPTAPTSRTSATSLAGRDDLFARSYLENAADVEPDARPGRRSATASDLDVFLRAHRGRAGARRERCRAPYPAAELRAITAVLAPPRAGAGRVCCTVNDAYIRSATLDDALRGEPPFLLQGSYRNMAKLAARIVAGHDRRRGRGGARRPLPGRGPDAGRRRPRGTSPGWPSWSPPTPRRAEAATPAGALGRGAGRRQPRRGG